MIHIIIGIVVIFILLVVWLVIRGYREPDKSEANMSEFLQAASNMYDEALENEIQEKAANANDTRISELIEDFDSSYDDAYIASEAIMRTGRSVVPHLVEALKEREGHKCVWAMRTLERMGSDARDAIPVLYDIMNDSTQKESRRREAKEVIAKIT